MLTRLFETGHPGDVQPIKVLLVRLSGAGAVGLIGADHVTAPSMMRTTSTWP